MSEEVKFFCRPNLAIDDVTVLEKPWEIKVDEAVANLPKEAYRSRWTNPDTKHYLLLMAEGQNPDYCVGVGNQASNLYGFMADYDGVLTDDLIEVMQKKPISRYCPRYWARSHSGKLHLFWFFERSIAVTGNVHATELTKIIAKKIKAAKWGVGYDPSCESVTQVMDIGRDWHVFKENAFIPSEEIAMWDLALFERSAKAYVQNVVDIPTEIVIEEIRRRKWPLEPPGDLRIGTRCRRFWDASADNGSAAQMTKDGFRVYTPHDGGFKSWASLFGPEFCEEYTAKSMAPFFEDTTYCQAKDEYYRFFRNDEVPHYEKRTEKVLRRDLVKEARLSTKAGKNEDLSEVDQALYTINRKNSVDVVAPMLYRKAGRINDPDLGRILNTSLVVVKKPAPRLCDFTEEMKDKYPNCPTEYRENPMLCRWDNPYAVNGFPHIHRLLTGFFMSNQGVYNKWISAGAPLHGDDGAAKPWLSDIQLMFFLSWLSHFYVNAARQSVNPGRGQAMILAGPAGVGKSFLGCVLLGQLMGGATDGKEFYLKGGRFNAGIVGCPVHFIDDQLGSTSHKLRLQFTEALKVVVANARLRYEAKFGSAVEAIRWPGRIVILANDDAQSLSVLPDLDMSTRDKFMMLKAGGVKFHWGTDAENQLWLSQELPYFARFLLGWEIPADIRDERFGVRAMQHSDMARVSAENGLTHTLLEVLEACIESSLPSKDSEDAGDRRGYVIEGNTIQVFKWIVSKDPSFTKEIIDSNVLRQSLTTLYKNGSFGIGYDEKTRRWSIPYVLRRKIENGVDTGNGGMV